MTDVVLIGRRSWVLWMVALLAGAALSLGALTAAHAAQNASLAATAEQVIMGYRAGEQAALRTLDADVLAQTALFATGEALAQLATQVQSLRANGAYTQLEIESFAVREVSEEAAQLSVITEEVHSFQTAPQSPGAVVEESRRTAFAVTYTLVQKAGRWKVSNVTAVEAGVR